MSMVACLIKGVNVLEKMRRGNRRKSKKDGDEVVGWWCNDERVHQWWTSYGYKLKQLLQLGDDDEKDDKSIFGAIYEWNPRPLNNPHAGDLPAFVIAFRGTIIGKATVKEDFQNNIKVVLNSIHNSARVEKGLKAVRGILSAAAGGGGVVWLAGYSLGAAIALAIGRNLVLKEGLYLQTYLYNPPFPSHEIKLVKTATDIFIKATLVSIADKLGKKKMVQEEDITALSKWRPHLFINKHDWICKEYGRHFEDMKKKTEEASAGWRSDKKLEMAMNSKRSLISGIVFRKDSEPSHLIPSAHLVTNLKRSEGLNIKEPHKLRQWWKPDMQNLDYKSYHFSMLCNPGY